MFSFCLFHDTVIFLYLPGTPCNKMTGYCDVFYRCRGVDPDTPLARIKNCITSGKCVAELKKFLKVFCLAIFILYTPLFIYFTVSSQCFNSEKLSQKYQLLAYFMKQRRAYRIFRL